MTMSRNFVAELLWSSSTATELPVIVQVASSASSAKGRPIPALRQASDAGLDGGFVSFSFRSPALGAAARLF